MHSYLTQTEIEIVSHVIIHDGKAAETSHYNYVVCVNLSAEAEDRTRESKGRLKVTEGPDKANSLCVILTFAGQS